MEAALQRLFEAILGVLEAYDQTQAERPVQTPLPTDLPRLDDPPVTNPLIFRGHPHKDYCRDPRKLEPLFSDIFPRRHRTSYAREVKRKWKISRSTVYGWRDQWIKNEAWWPWKTEVHGFHLRYFTDEQEAQMAEIILSQYIAVGGLFTSGTFRALAIQFWQDLGNEAADFKCSDHFITDFKTRNGFSSRRSHMRRRNPDGAGEKIERWTADIRDLLQRYDDSLELAVNCDETAWRVIPTGLLTWAPVGTDAVNLRCDGSEKDSVTVLASVTARGDKPPFFAIAKGKTPRVKHSQLGIDEALVRDHSPSGWSTVETFRHYLDWLAAYSVEQCPGRIGRELPLHLILDYYSVHRSEEIKRYAERLGIRLWFIPAGHTDELQPLARAVFGAMKAVFRRIFEEQRRQSPNDRITKSGAVQILIDIWNNLSTASIRQGWAIYEEDFGPSDDDDGDWEE